MSRESPAQAPDGFVLIGLGTAAEVQLYSASARFVTRKEALTLLSTVRAFCDRCRQLPIVEMPKIA
jgi:hypothetical protein